MRSSLPARACHETFFCTPFHATKGATGRRLRPYLDVGMSTCELNRGDTPRKEGVTQNTESLQTQDHGCIGEGMARLRGAKKHNGVFGSWCRGRGEASVWQPIVPQAELQASFYSLNTQNCGHGA